jgi:hypothetical protein
MRITGSVMMPCWKLVHNNTKSAEDSRLTLVNENTYSCQGTKSPTVSRSNGVTDWTWLYAILQCPHPKRWRVGSSDEDGKHQLSRQTNKDCTRGSTAERVESSYAVRTKSAQSGQANTSYTACMCIPLRYICCCVSLVMGDRYVSLAMSSVSAYTSPVPVARSRFPGM